jgi:hypothetical protein
MLDLRLIPLSGREMRRIRKKGLIQHRQYEWELQFCHRTIKLVYNLNIKKGKFKGGLTTFEIIKREAKCFIYHENGLY